MCEMKKKCFFLFSSQMERFILRRQFFSNKTKVKAIVTIKLKNVNQYNADLIVSSDTIPPISGSV